MRKIQHDANLDNVQSDNNILFIGMGLMSIGMLTTFVGLGDKGFKTSVLKLLGPCLVLFGTLLVVLRVLLCFVGAHGQVKESSSWIHNRNQKDSQKSQNLEKEERTIT